MALVETESLVLKSFNLAEADKIVVFFSREHGVVRGVAKGAKRLNSKFGSALEPFTYARITYFQKEVLELVSLQRAEIIRSYFAAASDPDFLSQFSYLSDLLLAVSPPHDPNETLFRMVRSCLEASDMGPGVLPFVVLYFELWLLRLSGFSPDWSACDVCSRRLDVDENAALSATFHVVCRDCQRATAATMVRANQRQFFTLARRLSPADFCSTVSKDRADVAGLSEILRRIFSRAIGREVVGEAFAETYNSR
jgi:DNA repair protein RecO (recombination protein O)